MARRMAIKCLTMGKHFFFRWKTERTGKRFRGGFRCRGGEKHCRIESNPCVTIGCSLSHAATELCFHSFNVFVAHASTYTSSAYTFLFRWNQWKRSIGYTLIRQWHTRLGRFCACIVRPICASWFQCGVERGLNQTTEKIHIFGTAKWQGAYNWWWRWVKFACQVENKWNRFSS